MPKFNVNISVRTWIDKEVVAKTREEAEAKVLKGAKKHMNSDGFNWISGNVECMGSINCSLLNKIPY